MAYNPDRLTNLGRRLQRHRAAVDTLRPEIAEEIRTAHEAGMSQVDIVRATGYTRDQIRQICLPPERRRSRASDRVMSSDVSGVGARAGG